MKTKKSKTANVENSTENTNGKTNSQTSNGKTNGNGKTTNDSPVKSETTNAESAEPPAPKKRGRKKQLPVIHEKQIVDMFDAINAMTPEKREAIIKKMEKHARILKLANGDTVDAFIYITQNVDQFSFIEGNREIAEDSVRIRDLAESIKEVGTNVAPVVVNEDKKTIDGQRRISAKRKYALPNPVRYTFSEGANLDTVGQMNRNQQPWNHKNWLDKYVTKGVPDYIEYQKLEEKYGKYMRPRSLRSLYMNNRIEAFDRRIWENGGYKLDRPNKPRADAFMELLVKIAEVGAEKNIFAGNRNFQKALHQVFMNTPNLDEERLLAKFRNNFNRINIRTEYPDYLKNITDLYNERLRSGKGSKIKVLEDADKK